MHSLEKIMENVHGHLPQGAAPKIGMILGSGLSSLADELTEATAIPYQSIPGLQTGGVAGHASTLVIGKLNGTLVACLKGRLHLYEGVGYEPIQILIRILKHLGCQTVIVTCAAGSIRRSVRPGSLMLIKDHINFHPGNPLAGPNDDSVGPRFLAMEDAYDLGLRSMMKRVAKELQIPLPSGVYLSTLGPSFETPAEIRAFKRWGADAVGMSVVPEVILARHCGMKVVCVAAITNLAAGLSKEKISHEGTLQFGEVAAYKLVKLIPEFIKELEIAME